MDLGGGAVSMDGLVVGASSEGGSLLSCSLTASNGAEAAACGRAKGCGFPRLVGGGRAAPAADPDDCEWRSLKMARTEAALPGSASHSLSLDGEQMLSFSSAPAKQDAAALMLGGDGGGGGSQPYYYCAPPASSPAPSFLRHAGMYASSSDMNMNGVLARVRGPFTPSQWLELEHQALIYKHIVAKVPIPPSLLIPIRRSLISSGFPPFSPGSFGSNAMGWGSFYLGYPGSTDPEPGRCRRTDGKKWRCSRDAVADQKYCERHMNRGRHRSRKHVEGQSGHAAKAMPAITSSQSAAGPASGGGGGGSSSGPRGAQPQAKNAQSNVDGACPAPFNMMMLSKQNANNQGQDPVSLSMLTSMNAKPMNTLFSASKQQNADFRLVSADPRLNSACSSFSDNRFIPSLKLEVLQSQSHPLHHFIDAWPKGQSDHSSVTWPEIEDTQFDRTQLSMSIPMASSEFSSSSSPNHENLTLSPLKLSREYDHVHMDSRLSMLNEMNQRQAASWIPISWEASMAGPLGEALTNTSNTKTDQSKICSSSSLNLLTDGWDSSPRMESSPTGVLQKTSFGSLTSSTGSSPRAENNKKSHESTGSLSDDLLGPTVVGVPSI